MYTSTYCMNILVHTFSEVISKESKSCLLKTVLTVCVCVIFEGHSRFTQVIILGAPVANTSVEIRCQQYLFLFSAFLLCVN